MQVALGSSKVVMTSNLKPLVVLMFLAAIHHVEPATTYHKDFYTVYEVPKTYSSAQSFCEAGEGTLAVPENEEAYQAILAAILEQLGSIAEGIWIAGKRNADSLYFLTPEDRPVTYFDWTKRSNIIVSSKGRIDPDNILHDRFSFEYYPIHEPEDEASCLKIDDNAIENDGKGDFGYYGSTACTDMEYFVCQNFSEPSCDNSLDGCRGDYERNLDDYCFWGFSPHIANELYAEPTQGFAVLGAQFDATAAPKAPPSKSPPGPKLYDALYPEDPRLKCSKNGGNLLSVFSETEYEEFINKGILIEGDSYIFGLAKDPLNGIFRWPNGMVLTWNRWLKLTDDIGDRKKRSITATRANSRNHYQTWMLVDYSVGGTLRIGEDILSSEVESDGSWGLEVAADFDRNIVCEAIKEDFALFNAPKVRGADISVPDNNTLVYTCRQPGYVIRGTTSRSITLSTHCLVDALQLQAEGINCICANGDNYAAETCTCEEGYGFDEDKLTCSEIQFCDSRPCDHTCAEVEGNGFTCGCFDGYQLEEERVCIDIDECTDGNGECDQKCINTPGSYLCDCFPGYIVNDKSCEVPDERSQVTFTIPLDGIFEDALNDPNSDRFKMIVRAITEILAPVIQALGGISDDIDLRPGSIIAEVTVVTLAELTEEALREALVRAIETFNDEDLYVTLSNGERLKVLGNTVSWTAPNMAGNLEFNDPCSALDNIGYCMMGTECEVVNGQPKCSCEPGYGGPRCDRLEDEFGRPPVDQRPNTYNLVLLVLTCFLFVIVLIHSCCLCAVYQRRLAAMGRGGLGGYSQPNVYGRVPPRIPGQFFPRNGQAGWMPPGFRKIRG